jgi:hypothetical protein
MRSGGQEDKRTGAGGHGTGGQGQEDRSRRTGAGGQEQEDRSRRTGAGGQGHEGLGQEDSGRQGYEDWDMKDRDIEDIDRRTGTCRTGK